MPMGMPTFFIVSLGCGPMLPAIGLHRVLAELERRRAWSANDCTAEELAKRMASAPFARKSAATGSAERSVCWVL